MPFPSPGDLPDPGMEPASLMSHALAGGFSTTSTKEEVLTGLNVDENKIISNFK